MTKEEFLQLDAQLEKKEAGLIAQLEEIATKNPAVDGDYEPQMPNFGEDDEENLNEASVLPDIVAMTTQLENQLKEVRETREKIKNGTYGTCSNCSATISPERIRALPTAVLCITCAEKKIN